MRGRPPVAGLRAVVVAMMLAALPFGAVLAEQIRPTLPGLGAKPKAVHRARRPFRPTLPQRNPTRVSADITANIKVDATSSPLSASGAAASSMAGATAAASVAIAGENIPAQDAVEVAAAEPASASEATAALTDDNDTAPAVTPSDTDETASPGTDADPVSADDAPPADAAEASDDMPAEATSDEAADPAGDQAAAGPGDTPADEPDKTEEIAATEPEEAPTDDLAEQTADDDSAEQQTVGDSSPSEEQPSGPAPAAEVPAAQPEGEKPEPVDTAASDSESPEETGALAATEPAAGDDPIAEQAADESTDQPSAPKETARLEAESEPSPLKETARLAAEPAQAEAEPVEPELVAEAVEAEQAAEPEPAPEVEAKPVKAIAPSHDATVVIDVLPPPAEVVAAAPPSEPEAPAEDAAPMEMAAVTPPSEPAPAPAIPAVEETPSDAGADDASTAAQAVSGSEEAEPTEAAETPPSEETPPGETASEAEPDSDAAPPAAQEDATALEDAALPDAVAAPKDATVEAAPPPPPAHPVVAAIRAKLADPGFRKGFNAATLEGLEAFYDAREGPPLWIIDGGFSPKAKALIAELGNADDWGLNARDFDVPKADARASTEDEQAAAELDLAMAVLKYARYAQGGARSPSSFSPLFDQKPELRGTKTLLTGIAAAPEPAGYLTSLHPQHAQFKALRAALVKARARAAANGRNPRNDGEVQLLAINMERWRWLPRSLGSYHVWNNVPEFNVRVMKGGKPIYVEKTIVGQDKYATPFFSAPMRNIVFHPNWTVPPTIVKEDLAPKLQAPRGIFSPSKTDTLRRFGLSVSYKGEPVDADSVDWANVNVHTYTFTQDPGPTNVLGKFKFNFPNRHAIYMHDTVQPELFSERVRTLSHGCIRVHEPDRFAALLLAQDKGWSYAQVQGLVAKNTSTVIGLNRKVPVHLTYFTATIDENGGLSRFGDIYGIDNRMAAKLFENPARFPVPSTPAVVEQSRSRDQDRSARRRGGGGGLDDLISGLFGN